MCTWRLGGCEGGEGERGSGCERGARRCRGHRPRRGGGGGGAGAAAARPRASPEPRMRARRGGEVGGGGRGGAVAGAGAARRGAGRWSRDEGARLSDSRRPRPFPGGRPHVGA